VVSTRTVATHIQHIFMKLDLPDDSTDNRRVPLCSPRIAAVCLAINRTDSLPRRGRALEISAFVAVALAASATASTIGDRTTGGIAGTVISVGVLHHDLPSPLDLAPAPHPDTPGATPRLVTVLAAPSPSSLGLPATRLVAPGTRDNRDRRAHAVVWRHVHLPIATTRIDEHGRRA